MGRRIAGPFLCLLLLAVGLGGCSNALEAETERSTREMAALDRLVVALEPGISPAEVRDELGRPEAETGVEGEPTTMMVYAGGRWELHFEENRLDRRVKYPAVRRSRGIGEEGLLDRKIRALHRGMGIVTVRARLGSPRSYELGTEKEVVLWYGRWSLTFRGGALDTRTAW
jgi:hypothetical protein